MAKLHLQELINTVDYNNLPIEWKNFNTGDFSRDKTLFDFQQSAVQAIIKTLYQFYIGATSDKNKMLAWYKTFDNQIDALDITTTTKDGSFDLYRKHNYKVITKQYQKSKNKVEELEVVSFAEFTNRLCLWMATGSGKTLVIVKLIQLLNYLMNAELIPQCPILFLAHQEQLIGQLAQHISQYNVSHSDQYIELVNLRTNADDLSNDLFSHDKIRVYTYRSDLISDDEKDNQINYENYLNNGKWYIILDEAHKGASDSIRQTYYNIMSQNGFLFNFSATFTDNIDHATTCYEYNLSSFIKNGHGKNIYLSQKAIHEFKTQGELVEDDQRKIILRALVVLTYIKKLAISLKDSGLEYHNPMLVSFVNSVNLSASNTEEKSESSDLVKLFTGIADFATGEYPAGLLSATIDDLVKEYQSEDDYLFNSGKVNIDFNTLKVITSQDILEYVFNSNNFATTIEVKTISGNGKELVFKLPTSEQPFALIKIGDTRKWVTDNLANNTLYQINEKTFDNTSAFARLNKKDSSINMLFGSRSFYEGWDSNRPNVIMYINIGSRDAKKFVLQSTGRGIRLEPIKNKRKRIDALLTGNTELSDKYKSIIDSNPQALSALETLFVMGTSKEALDTVFNGLSGEQNDFEILDNFVVNPSAKDKLLLIPKYTDGESYFDLLNTDNKKSYAIHPQSLQLLRRYCALISDVVLIAKFGQLLTPDILNLRQYVNDDKSFFADSKKPIIRNPELLLIETINFYNANLSEYSHFAKLDQEIVHFRKIAVNDAIKRNKLIEVINKVKNSISQEEKLAEIKQKYANDIDKLIAKVTELNQSSIDKVELDDLVIKNISTHYYVPLILSTNEHIDYIKHIIKTPSEVKFITELDSQIEKLNDKFDWWMFSRIDSIDDVYIPYIDKNSCPAKFKPDFIFWLKPKNNDHYLIYFIDPKGDSYTDYQLKIDGYKNIFEGKYFEHRDVTKCCDLSVEVHCKLVTAKNINEFPLGYRNYWINTTDLTNILN